METNTSEDITQVFSTFKSYYVVWKLLQLCSMETAKFV